VKGNSFFYSELREIDFCNNKFLVKKTTPYSLKIFLIYELEV
jgi:hypothetical protein